MRALSVLLLSCCLAGCAASPEESSLWSGAGELGQRLMGAVGSGSNDSRAADQAMHAQVAQLLDQPRIDPLTRFLEQHAAQDANDRSYQYILRERNSRCRAIGTRFSQQALTDENLALFRSGYQYSCPDQVDAFAQRLALTPPATASPAETIATGPVSARQQGQANSCYLLFTIKNYQQALPSCIETAERGDAKAQHHLAIILQVNDDPDQAYHWARHSAAQQHAPGQLLLAQLYQQGQGTPIDEVKALTLLEDAAESGLAAAQYEAGVAYLHGSGKAADRGAAQRWLERAAGQDHLPAQLQLADLHFNDSGAEQAYARQWLLRAASQGSATAQYRLGASYMDGTGGPPDYTEAYIWLSHALRNGEPRAKPRIQALTGQLTADQLHTARQRIAAGFSGRLP
ncbi:MULTISPECIES: tetratricopeptide repeat protein [Halopseudomonas]|nr:MULTISPECIES: tetratricopeptide repeat protein [Halopseudomonas]WGK60480.1 tetratricopeptide repeat protein [Halopseudomonas sp. SMJS2]